MALGRPDPARQGHPARKSEPGVGKSTLALELAARVSRGSAMPIARCHEDARHEPANVIIFCSGDDGLADTVRPRLDVAGADLTQDLRRSTREIDKRRLIEALEAGPDHPRPASPSYICRDPASGSRSTSIRKLGRPRQGDRRRDPGH